MMLIPCPYCGHEYTINSLVKHLDMPKGAACEVLSPLAKHNYHAESPICVFCEESVANYANLKEHCDALNPRCPQLQKLVKYTTHHIPTWLVGPLARLATPWSNSDLWAPSCARGSAYEHKFILLDTLVQRSHLAKPDKWQSLIPGGIPPELSQRWQSESNPDYSLVLWEKDLNECLRNGVLLPILIPAGAPAANRGIQFREGNNSFLSGPTFDLVNAALRPANAANPSVQAIRARFGTPLSQKSLPWEPIKICDALFAYRESPCPDSLRSQDLLRRCQTSSKLPIDLALAHTNTNDNDSRPTTLPNANANTNLDRWTQFLEAGTIQLPHLDTPLGTWMHCLRGSTILWFQRAPSNHDMDLWAAAGDPRAYGRSWAGIRLVEGDTIILPPALLHTTYTPHDTLFSGGHFATPATLDRTLVALHMLERQSTLYFTSTFSSSSSSIKSIPADIHKVLLGFCLAFLSGLTLPSAERMERILASLKEYCTDGSRGRSIGGGDEDYFRRKRIFVETVRVMDVVGRLETLTFAGLST